MCKKKDKIRLYRLMEHYLDGKIDECTFRDKYYRLYALEIGRNSASFSIEEKTLFFELEMFLNQFAPDEQFHKRFPGSFWSKQELHDKIRDTYET
jgi:hypothetical protein